MLNFKQLHYLPTHQHSFTSLREKRPLNNACSVNYSDRKELNDHRMTPIRQMTTEYFPLINSTRPLIKQLEIYFFIRFSLTNFSNYFIEIHNLSLTKYIYYEKKNYSFRINHIPTHGLFFWCFCTR